MEAEPKHPRLPGLLLNQVAWTERLERMAATALKYGSEEGAAQVIDLAERIDGINQVHYQDGLDLEPHHGDDAA